MTERICPKCNKAHKGEKLPPSQSDRLNLCFLCYSRKKRKATREWTENNKDLVRQSRKRYLKTHPKETAIGWKTRTEVFKAKKHRNRPGPTER